MIFPYKYSKRYPLKETEGLPPWLVYSTAIILTIFFIIMFFFV